MRDTTFSGRTEDGRGQPEPAAGPHQDAPAVHNGEAAFRDHVVGVYMGLMAVTVLIAGFYVGLLDLCFHTMG